MVVRRVRLVVARQAGLPPCFGLGTEMRQLRLGVNETLALERGQLVLLAHRDGVNRAHLGAEPAEEAPARLQDELAQLAVAFLGRNDVHLEAAGWADAGAEATGDAERLTRLRISAQGREAAEPRHHRAPLFRLLGRQLRGEEPLQRDGKTLGFVEHEMTSLSVVWSADEAPGTVNMVGCSGRGVSPLAVRIVAPCSDSD